MYLERERGRVNPNPPPDLNPSYPFSLQVEDCSAKLGRAINSISVSVYIY